MAIHHIQITGVKSLQRTLDRVAHPFWTIIEFRTADASYFGYEVVGGARKGGLDGGLGESASDELFGGTIVGGGIERADSEGKCARDYAVGWERKGVGI